jgi:uncharacterized protein DUF6491
MKTHAALAAGAAALLAFAASAASAADTPVKNDPPAKNQCFWARNVTSFAAPDDRTVYVQVSSRDVYKFDLMVSCPDIDWNQRLALTSSGGSGGSICSNMDAQIVSRATGIGRQRCPISHMRKLTPEEIAALPRRARP